MNYYYADKDNKPVGPCTLDQLHQLYASGTINAKTFIIQEGGTQWTEYADLLKGQAQTPTPQGAAPLHAHNLNHADNRNNFAMVGMILGIFSLTLGLCCCYGFPFNIAGIVFSALALKQIKENPMQSGSKGMAITGLITSIVSVAVGLLMLFLGVALNMSEFMKNMPK